MQNEAWRHLRSRATSSLVLKGVWIICSQKDIFILIILIFIIAYFSLDVWGFFVTLRFHGSECVCTLPNVLEWWSLWWQLFQERRAVATEMEGTAKREDLRHQQHQHWMKILFFFTQKKEVRFNCILVAALWLFCCYLILPGSTSDVQGCWRNCFKHNLKKRWHSSLLFSSPKLYLQQHIHVR